MADENLKIEQDKSNPSESSINQYVNTISTQSRDEMKKSCGCAEKDVSSPNFVYAIGKITFRYPDISLEKELWQSIGRKSHDVKGLATPEVFSKALIEPNNRYIARKLCWVFEIEGIPTYILYPSESNDIDKFVNGLRSAPTNDDIDLIIGIRGPLAGPKVCNGLSLPIVSVDQIYSFEKDELLKAIPKSKIPNEEQFLKTANAIFQHIMQIADNVGSTDEHRALNYLSVRYDQIYSRTQLMQDRNFSLKGVEAIVSRLSGTRKIIDVIFTFEERNSAAVEKWFTRVDLTEEFPFLVTPLQQFFER